MGFNAGVQKMLHKIRYIALFISLSAVSVVSFRISNSPIYTSHRFRTKVIMNDNVMELSRVSFRVSSVQKSIDFYTKGLGMKILSQISSTKAILGYSTESTSSLNLEIFQEENTVISPGEGYLGIGIQSPDIDAIVDNSLKNGGEIYMKVDNYAYAASLIPDENDLMQFPVRYGKLSDPDGYIVEVIEKPQPHPNPFTKVILNVLDLDESSAFYTNTFGMTQIRKRSNVLGRPREASMCSYMSFSREAAGTFLELVYKYATDKIDVGSGFSHLQLQSVSDAPTVLLTTLQAGAQASIEADEEGSQFVVLRDPSNYKVTVACAPS